MPIKNDSDRRSFHKRPEHKLRRSFQGHSSFLVLFLVLFHNVLFVEAVDIRSCDIALGLESGDIPDDSITASSSYVPNVGPKNGRLRSERAGGGWCPKLQVERGVREWLQVDLGRVHIVTGVQTQGRYDRGRGQEYAEEYTLEYWRPGLPSWRAYHRWDGKQILTGNSDTATVVTHRLMPPIYASGVRILPYSVHRRTVCLRAEIRGCVDMGGVVTYRTPETASDFTDTSYDGETVTGELVGGLGLLVDGEYGADNFKLDIGYGKGNGWVAWKNDSFPNKFVEIIFEFDQLRNFSTVHIFCNNFFSKGVQIFSKARIYFSSSGEQWGGRALLYTNLPDRTREAARNITVDLHGRVAQFVKLRLYFGSPWIMLAEVSFESEPIEGNFTDELQSNEIEEEFIVNPEVEVTWETFETIAARPESDGYMEVVIGVLTAVVLLLLTAFVIVALLNRRHKLLQGGASPATVLRNPFGVTINMKDLLMNLAPNSNNSPPTPINNEPAMVNGEPASLSFDLYSRSPLVDNYYKPNYSTLCSTDLDEAYLKKQKLNNTNTNLYINEIENLESSVLNGKVIELDPAICNSPKLKKTNSKDNYDIFPNENSISRNECVADVNQQVDINSCDVKGRFVKSSLDNCPVNEYTDSDQTSIQNFGKSKSKCENSDMEDNICDSDINKTNKITPRSENEPSYTQYKKVGGSKQRITKPDLDKISLQDADVSVLRSPDSPDLYKHYLKPSNSHHSSNFVNGRPETKSPKGRNDINKTWNHRNNQRSEDQERSINAKVLKNASSVDLEETWNHQTPQKRATSIDFDQTSYDGNDDSPIATKMFSSSASYNGSSQNSPVSAMKSNKIINLGNYFPRVETETTNRKRYHTAPREKNRVPPPVVCWNIIPSMAHAYNCREVELVPIPRYCLKTVEKIGVCHAGEMSLYETENLSDIVPGVGRFVLVRSTSGANAMSMEGLRELRFLAALRDCHLARVLGVVTAEQPPWCVQEYGELGNLAHYLQQSSRIDIASTVDISQQLSTNILSDNSEDAGVLSYECLMYMATQIALGMKYLESRRICHKDLATRNCLVNTGHRIKICDVAICNPIFKKDYSEVGGKPPTPIRWLPWESILMDRYTSASSVWSYAVTLWEILSLARERPFRQLTCTQVVQNVEHMYYGGDLQVSLPQPSVCPHQIWALITTCWRRDEDTRPTFKQIAAYMKRHCRELNIQDDI